MKHSVLHQPQEGYSAPSVRFVDLTMDQSFLVSNLEPIDGGDDPDLNW